MSGTSADGVDAALVDISERSGKIKVHLLAFLTRPYPRMLRNRLLFVSEPGGGNTAELTELNFRVGEVFAQAALDVCAHAGVAVSRMKFIASHGQTVAHLPARGATLQIGEGSVIAIRTGVPVVYDFRPADMIRGGQGAPLTPLADFHFFRHPKKNRAIVNIGGITNVTILRGGIKSIEEIIGFDTGFGNMALDGMARLITGGKMSCDKNGRLARSGKIREDWMGKILSHPFFLKKPPKSAGREEFGANYQKDLRVQLNLKTYRDRIDLLSTLTAAIPRTVLHGITRFALPINKVDEVLLCGGGAHNPVLLKHFIETMRPATVKLTDEYGVPGDAREAMAFALLGYLTMKRKPGNVPSVTGASQQSILGKIIYP
jgi:anhydro-N-acetylmuramic acid kinase